MMTTVVMPQCIAIPDFQEAKGLVLSILNVKGLSKAKCKIIIIT